MLILGIAVIYLYFRESDVAILSQVDDIQQIMEEHYIKTLAMRGSAFVKPHEGKNIFQFYIDILHVPWFFIVFLGNDLP